jgi:hypothetical protein
MINNNNRTGVKAALAVTVFVAIFAIQAVVAGRKFLDWISYFQGSSINYVTFFNVINT